ncbi:uncharacterized protein LOC118645759 [Monomorium pharaonis]|uniref:uncharacterized protein LOC118645759 n=1 Tax=Monomorium pharaonis TaxID=307658 RepID=UPI001746A24B|nr:uncharacterized protein LOC118645759 [Monomorium pharaonis]
MQSHAPEEAEHTAGLCTHRVCMKRNGTNFHAPVRIMQETERTLRFDYEFRPKNQAWIELLDSLKIDPWGRPFKIVLNKIKGLKAPLTQTLDKKILKVIITYLFPNGNTITDEELINVAKHTSNKKAPGPDGIHGSIIKKTLIPLSGHWKICINAYLRDGIFPNYWKSAMLTLIKKPGKPDGTPSSYRPICLISEAGKYLERIISNRIITYLEKAGELSDFQYGFPKRRSTIDAIGRVKSIIDEYTSEDKIVFMRIHEAAKNKNLPTYLRKMLFAYLSNRVLTYYNSDGKKMEKNLTCGVPQRSALGPVLWIMAFDRVLNFTGGDTDTNTAKRKAELALDMVYLEITRLRLKIATNKTDVVVFAKKQPQEYVGIKVRIEIAHSVLMYSAPIWGSKIYKDKKIKQEFRRLQRLLAVKVVAGYHTIAYDAAITLARLLPADILAKKLCSIYNRIQANRNIDIEITILGKKMIREEENKTIADWKSRLEKLGPNAPGRRIREAILPNIELWYNRGGGDQLTFRLTQVLTGHGSFSHFLFRINRNVSPHCRHCGADIDDAHTLTSCNEWDEHCSELKRVIGEDLTLQTVITAMLTIEDGWSAMIRFSEAVMSSKEEEKRGSMDRSYLGLSALPLPSYLKDWLVSVTNTHKYNKILRLKSRCGQLRGEFVLQGSFLGGFLLMKWPKPMPEKPLKQIRGRVDDWVRVLVGRLHRHWLRLGTGVEYHTTWEYGLPGVF